MERRELDYWLGGFIFALLVVIVVLALVSVYLGLKVNLLESFDDVRKLTSP